MTVLYLNRQVPLGMSACNCAVTYCPVDLCAMQPQQEASNADSDDDWSMGSKKGKKGKAAAAGKGKGKAAAANSGGAAAGNKQQKGAADVNSILSATVLSQQVLKLYPDMEDAGE